MINAQRKTELSVPLTTPETALRSLYLEALQLVERLHRRLLDVVRTSSTATARATSMRRRRFCFSTSAIRN